MFTPLSEKVVVLTGATKGIGRGIALKFAEAKAKLFLINRHQHDGETLVEELNAMGCEAYSFAADVSSEKELLLAMQYATERFNQVDILCANAGIYPCKKLESISSEEWDLVSDVNLKGTFLTVKTFLPLLKKAEDGRIILTSSITGPVTGFPGWTHYGATKAGQLGFMRSAALELATYGITVNAVLPGNIVTESFVDLGQEHVENMARAIPLKKLGQVDDVAHAVLFLASKEAGFITGQTLIIDGGQTLPETVDSLG